MQYFLETVETIEPGMGFSLFSPLHLAWLVIGAAVITGNYFWYRKLSHKGKTHWRKGIALLLLADEAFKITVLLAGNRFDWCYLPLHLCSINIFTIAWHAWKPSNLLDNFLYTVCIPGAMAALVFPSWVSLPLNSGIHIHSFSAHILLVLYPMVLTVAGDIRPDIKRLPACMGMLLLLAVPIYVVNQFLGTNFMFLMYAESGNPLYLFEQMWGSHLLGFPVIIAAVLIVMHVPILLCRKLKRYKKNPEDS